MLEYVTIFRPGDPRCTPKYEICGSDHELRVTLEEQDFIELIRTGAEHLGYDLVCSTDEVKERTHD